MSFCFHINRCVLKLLFCIEPLPNLSTCIHIPEKNPTLFSKSQRSRPICWVPLSGGWPVHIQVSPAPSWERLGQKGTVVLHKSITICSFPVKILQWILQLLSWPKTAKSRSCEAVEPVQIAFWTSPRPQLWLLTAPNLPGKQLAKDLKETHCAWPSPLCSECWNLLILCKGVRRLDPPTRDASLSLWMRANKFSHRFCISSKLSWLDTKKVPESSEAVPRILKVSHVSLVLQSHLSYAHLLHKKTGDWFEASDKSHNLSCLEKHTQNLGGSRMTGDCNKPFC